MMNRLVYATNKNRKKNSKKLNRLLYIVVVILFKGKTRVYNLQTTKIIILELTIYIALMYFDYQNNLSTINQLIDWFDANSKALQIKIGESIGPVKENRKINYENKLIIVVVILEFFYKKVGIYNL